MSLFAALCRGLKCLGVVILGVPCIGQDDVTSQSVPNSDCVQRAVSLLTRWSTASAPPSGTAIADTFEQDMLLEALQWCALYKVGDAAEVVAKIARSAKSPSIRETAVETLSELGQAALPYTPLLVEYLNGDVSTIKRRPLLKAIKSMGPRVAEYVPGLSEMLHDPTRDLGAMRFLSAWEAGIAKYDVDVARFLRLDTRPAHLLAAVEAVLASSDACRAHLPELLDCLDGKHTSAVRAVILRAVKTAGPAAAPYVARILPALSDGSPQVRSSAATAFAAMGPAVAPYSCYLAPLLGDDRRLGRVRATPMQAALEAIKTLGISAAACAPEVLSLLAEDPHEQLILEAVAALKEAAVDDARRMLLSESRGNVIAGLRAFTVLPRDAAVVRRALDVLPEEGVRLYALELLQVMRLASTDHLGDIMPFLDEPEDVGATAVQVIGSMGANALPRVLPLLEAGNAEGRRQRGLQILAVMGANGVDVVPYALACLSDRDHDVQVAAAQALRGMSPVPQYADVIVDELLATPQGQLRELLAELLKAIPLSAHVAERFVGLLQNGTAEVAEEAASVLGSMPAKDLPRLLPLLVSGTETTQERVLRVLRDAAASESRRELVKVYGRRVLAILGEPHTESLHQAALRVCGAIGKDMDDQVTALVAFLKQQRSIPLRRLAVQAIGELGERALLALPTIEELVRETKDDGLLQDSLELLMKLGSAAAKTAPSIAQALNAITDHDTRISCHEALQRMGIEGVRAILRTDPDPVGVFYRESDSEPDSPDPQAQRCFGPLAENGPEPLTLLLPLLEAALSDRSRQGAACAFYFALFAEPTSQVDTLLRWVKPELEELPNETDVVTCRDVLSCLMNARSEMPKAMEDLRRRRLAYALDRAIIRLVAEAPWSLEDVERLQSLLAIYASTERRAVVQGTIDRLRVTPWPRVLSLTVLIHGAFWILLVVAYPRFRTVQAAFFWNPWVRRVAGLAYVEVVLTYTPFLRRRLLAPFRAALLADAHLDTFNASAYFADTLVRCGETQGSPREALAVLDGLVVLQGASGVGKSLILRDVARRSRRIAVFLPAHRCAEGPLAAIQAKLKGTAAHGRFLEQLIYNGALDICIDGLNEVGAETRSRIVAFAERFSVANIIIATQPMDWVPPASAKVWHMIPLSEDRVRRFLDSRVDHLPQGALVTGASYQRACAEFLGEPRRGNDGDASLAMDLLANPLDLTMIATLLSKGVRPNLLSLYQQAFEVMASDFAAKHNRPFPKAGFSEDVYKRVLRDEPVLNAEAHPEELACMEGHRLVVRRHAHDGTVRWTFRHDKIRDYFLVTALMQVRGRASKHLLDPRLRGGYLLLAHSLPEEDAMALREELIQVSARSKDHILSDEFVQIIHRRVRARR